MGLCAPLTPTCYPLAGITIVSMEQAVAAPFATRQLADLGARVIKVERPGFGDFARAYDETVHGQSSYFVWLNRSKESLTLDVKVDAGREILEELLAHADVFIQNLAPGSTARLGLDAGSLEVRYPNLIVCDVSGYGNSGPWSDRKAYDMLMQGETGLISFTGTPDAPSRVGISIADIAAGMYAYTGILTSLYRRATTGIASRVEIAMLEALGEWVAAPAYYTKYGGAEPRRVGSAHATIAPYGTFATADGASIVLAVQNEREWNRFCEVVLGDASTAVVQRFGTNAARVAHRDELETMIADRIGRLDSTAANKLLDDANIANARLNTVKDFLEHPSLTARERWRQVASPAGEVDALLPPAGLSGTSARMGPIPALGEHTEGILSELGRDRAAVELLRAKGAI